MAADWPGLRRWAPGSLVPAREIAHYALSWLARAATANVAAVPDDSHTALSWDAGLEALVTQPMPGGAKCGLHVAGLELIFSKGQRRERYALAGHTPPMVSEWLDAQLAGSGLKAASPVKLPYELPARSFDVKRYRSELEALAAWLGAAAELLTEVRAKYSRLRPGPDPVRLWPHHFDMAVLVLLEEGAARSIGIGISPGDHYYPQPYAYISPYPAPKSHRLPALPAGAHWHTADFFGAVATADELLALADPRAALLEVIDTAFQASRTWLNG